MGTSSSRLLVNWKTLRSLVDAEKFIIFVHFVVDLTHRPVATCLICIVLYLPLRIQGYMLLHLISSDLTGHLSHFFVVVLNHVFHWVNRFRQPGNVGCWTLFCPRRVKSPQKSLDCWAKYSVAILCYCFKNI